MVSGDVKLIGSTSGRSPFVLRARIALSIKSIEYEFLQEDLGSKSELLLKSNPVNKKVPVLIHEDKPISESLIIVQYIDEVWNSGPSILPSDPYERAVARFWAAYIDDKFYLSMKSINTAEGEEARKTAAITVKECLALLEEAYVKCSKGKDFFGEENIGLIDIAFGSYLVWLKIVEKVINVKLIEEDKTPNLFKWADKFASHPSVKDVLPETEEIKEYAKVLLARVNAPKN